MSPTHIYSSLPHVNSIRLIRLGPGGCDGPISCSLAIYDDYSSAPEYYALSYCWGDPNDTVELTCNSASYPVTKSLYTALDRLQEIPNLQLVWADAICINQNDVLERNQQVSIMQHIYQHASHVYIWAGRGDEHSASALELIRSIAFSCCEEVYKPISSPALWLEKLQQEADKREAVIRANPIKPEEMSLINWQPFWHFYQASWFFRVWVIQEVQSCPHIWLLSGKNKIEWDFVGLAATWIWHAQGLHSAGYWRRDYFPSYDAFRNSAFLLNRSFHTRREAPFTALLSLARPFLSTDPRDKVFALLRYPIMQISGRSQGTTTRYPLNSENDVLAAHLNLTANYNMTVCEVYRQVAVNSIKYYHNLELLCYAWQTAHLDALYPSWIPRWDVNIDDWIPRALLPFLYDTARGTSPRLKTSCEVNTLTIQGLNLGPIVGTDTVLRIERGQAFTDHSDGESSSNDYLTTISKIMVQDRWKGPGDLENMAERAHQNLSAHFADFSAYLLPLLKIRKVDCYIPFGSIFCNFCNEFIVKSRQTILQPPRFYTCLNCNTSFDICAACYNREKRCEIPGHVLKSTIAPSFWCPFTDEIINRLEPHAAMGNGGRFFDTAQCALVNREFLWTSQGLRGVGPETVEPGDTLVILFGSRVPFILRKHDKFYRLIGDCYINGLMDGEAIQMWETGELEIEDFDIR